MQLQPKVLTICAYCSQPIEKWRYQFKAHPRHFCSNKCKGKWMSLHLIAAKSANWKGGSYSTIANTLCNSRYRRIRKTVLHLDGNECVMCSLDHRLESHHIIEKGKNPALIWDVTNMITLCKKCHCSIRGREEEFVGFFDGIVAKRMNSEKPRTGNSEPSLVQSKKVQRLLEGSTLPLITSKSVLHESDDIV